MKPAKHNPDNPFMYFANTLANMQQIQKSFTFSSRSGKIIQIFHLLNLYDPQDNRNITVYQSKQVSINKHTKDIKKIKEFTDLIYHNTSITLMRLMCNKKRKNIHFELSNT